MLNAYAIGVTATLEDNVSNRLMLIVEWADKANASMLEFAETARKASTAGAGMARNFEKAAAATALGDSSAGLTRASYVLDTMAASSGDLARNMAAARAEANGMRTPGGGGGRPGGGEGSAGPSGGRAATEPRSSATSTAVGAAGAGLAFGIYENAKLNNIVTRAVVTDGTPASEQAAAVDAYMKRIRADAGQYGFAAQGLPDFAESYLSASRLLRGMPTAGRMSIIDTIMPYAAQESSLKGISLDESMKAFIGAAHMSGAYDQKSIESILPALINTSLSTNASMQKIENAAGYAVPILRTGLGIEPSKVFTMIAMMQRAGISNSKSGTWIADLFMNAIPKNFGAGLFHSTNQIKALKELGLMDGHDKLTYLDSKGGIDPLKMLDIAARHAALLTPIERASASKQAFGTQGARALSIFTDPKMMAMLPVLEAAMTTLENPQKTLDQVKSGNAAAQAKQTVTNLELTATNVAATFNGPINAVMSGAAGASGWMANNPVEGASAFAAALVGGALGGKFAWNVIKSASGLFEKGIVSVISRAVVALGGEELAAGAMVAIGGEVVLGAVLLAGVTTLLAHGLKWAMDKIPTAAPPPGWNPKGIDQNAAHGVTTGHPSYAHMPPVHVQVQVDSHDVAAHVTTRLIPPNTLGPSGFNPSSSPIRPSMSSPN
jgi:hypothetical protein